MKYAWFALLLFSMTNSGLAAQQPEISDKTSVNSSLIRQWLQSENPRLIAWAADFARRKHDAATISEMPALLEHWTMPPADGGDQSQIEWRRAVIAVLDTLIQENVQVTIPTIKAVAPYFPNQAIILIARLPISESRLTLNDWTYGLDGPLFARVASMIVAKDLASMQTPAFDLVSRVLAASEENLQISVRSRDSDQPGLGGSGGICGVSLPRTPSPGWPQIYTYTITENDPGPVVAPIVDLNGDRIVAWRREMNQGWGTCNGVEWLNSRTRHRLLAYWLGVHEKDMLWQPEEEASIVWKNKAAYKIKLGAIIEDQRERLDATVETLRQRGLLTDYEADVIQPKMVVIIKCGMTPCPLDHSKH